MKILTSLLDSISNPLNIILSLVAVFQWHDRRSRAKNVEHSLWAAYQMSARMKKARPKDDLIREKSDDICDNLLGVMRSLNGDKLWDKPPQKLRG